MNFDDLILMAVVWWIILSLLGTVGFLIRALGEPRPTESPTVDVDLLLDGLDDSEDSKNLRAYLEYQQQWARRRSRFAWKAFETALKLLLMFLVWPMILAAKLGNLWCSLPVAVAINRMVQKRFGWLFRRLNAPVTFRIFRKV